MRGTRTSSCPCRTTRWCTGSVRCCRRCPATAGSSSPTCARFTRTWAHPGKKLLFMGGELATPWEWTEQDELPWGLLDHLEHSGVRDLVRDLNSVYHDEPALWEVDFS